jgi:hypothetical protein
MVLDSKSKQDDNVIEVMSNMQQSINKQLPGRNVLVGVESSTKWHRPFSLARTGVSFNFAAGFRI